MKRIYYYLLILVLALGACEESEYLNSGDFFHLSNKGAKLPVWVNGNFNSDVMLITVSGGPGDSGMEQHIAKGYQLLEEDYMMVYWDQRYCGMTQGHYDIETQTPDQFIEDTEKLVELLIHKYPGKKLFMMGHSWGGQLSAGYLGRDNHDDLFKGWIDMDGSIYGDLEVKFMKQYILERLPEKLAEPDVDMEFWQIIIDFYENKDESEIGNYTDPEPYWYVSALGGDVYDYDKFLEQHKIPYAQLIFKSMFSMSFYNESFYSKESQQLWSDLNYTQELEQMTIPSLLLWGADDGIVPHQVADYVYEHLGTDEADKYVVKIPECGHGPHSEHPERVYDEVSSFIEKYKNK